MVKTLIKTDFENNGKYKLKETITGKIVKISIGCQNFFPEFRVRILTNEGESLADDNLQDIFTHFYPINFMPEADFKDYFYIDGTLHIEVNGLNQGNKIDYIKIFYI